ncbi:MAG: hypothetical protein JRH08_07990 [Deltaproteobacteria bacterium]|nr:hypothetical protein [Deltaproteobacteria bacterium]
MIVIVSSAEKVDAWQPIQMMLLAGSMAAGAPLYHLMDTKRMPLFLDYLKEHLFGFRISDGYNILEMAGAASHVHMGIMGLFFIMAGVAPKAIYLTLLPMVKCSPICMAICTGKTPMGRIM